MAWCKAFAPIDRRPQWHRGSLASSHRAHVRTQARHADARIQATRRQGILHERFSPAHANPGQRIAPLHERTRSLHARTRPTAQIDRTARTIYRPRTTVHVRTRARYVHRHRRTPAAIDRCRAGARKPLPPIGPTRRPVARAATVRGLGPWPGTALASAAHHQPHDLVVAALLRPALAGGEAAAQDQDPVGDGENFDQNLAY